MNVTSSSAGVITAVQSGSSEAISDLVIESLDEFAAPAYTCSTNADYIIGAVPASAYN
jgi:hypothetical protein